MKTTMARGEICRTTMEFDEKDIKDALLLLMHKHYEHLLMPLGEGYTVNWEFRHPIWDSEAHDFVYSHKVTFVQSIEIMHSNEVQP